MKYVLLPLFISVFCLQKPCCQNIDRDAIPIDYVLLPLQKLPDSTETFYVSVKNRNTIWGNSLGNTMDADAISFTGYYKLTSTYDADVITDVEVTNDLQFAQVELVTTNLKYRVDKNTEIPYTAYTYNVKYINPIVHYKIYSGNGTTITDGTVGGNPGYLNFGSIGYKDSYKSEYQLSRTWSENRKYQLAGSEASGYKSSIFSVAGIVGSYCPLPAHVSFTIKYVKEKKTTDYNDLLTAKNLFTEAADYFKTDRIVLINKVVQPDYNRRNALLDSAIRIWEKALEESDLNNKKARIDQKVTRHIYYNLAFAHALKNDFDKAQQYLQGREDEETNSVVGKNLFAGMKNLSGYIDQQKKRMVANSWRPLLLAEPDAYVYKDPATRKIEKEELAKQEAAKQKAMADSIQTAKKKTLPGKTTAKKTTTKPAATKLVKQATH